MNEKLENIMELPILARMGIFAGSIVVLAGGYWMWFYSPLSEEVANLETEIAKLQVEISTRRGLVARLPQAEKRVEELDAHLNKALQELPDQREIPQLLARVSDRAKGAGLNIRLFRPLPEQNKEFYAEVPVEIRVKGTYHQVATFFDEVGHLERIVNLGNYVLSNPQPGKKNETVLNTKVIATAFRFLEKSERSPEKGKKRRGRRGRRGRKGR